MTMGTNGFPPRPGETLERNTRSLAVALGSLDVSDAERIAEAIQTATDDMWRSWDEQPPEESDGHIVGRDCLGYIHLATHLVGAQRTWADEWMPVSDAKQQGDRSRSPVALTSA